MLETIVKFSLVPVPVLPLMHSIAMILAILPLSDVRLSIGAFPDTEALLNAKVPLTVVNLAVRPGECALSVQLIVQILAEVGGPVFKELVPASVTLIILPFALIHATVLVDENAETLALALD